MAPNHRLYVGADVLRLLILGDSIATGAIAPPGASWPELVIQHLRDRGNHVEALNLSESHQTVLGALDTAATIPDSSRFDLAIVALGTNDARKNVYPDGPDGLRRFTDDLVALVNRLRAHTSRIVLVGQFPILDVALPTDGSASGYARVRQDPFEQCLQRAGSLPDVTYVPALSAVLSHCGDEQLAGLLVDGLHPNRQGHELIAELVWPTAASLMCLTSEADPTLADPVYH